MDLHASEAITDAVLSWPGVEVGPGRFNSIRFAVGKRELGHLHGDRLADFPFTRAIRDELIAAGRVRRHTPLPDSGWASRDIVDEADVQDVIALMRMQYERAVAKQPVG
jgi:hypothetical protein